MPSARNSTQPTCSAGGPRGGGGEHFPRGCNRRIPLVLRSRAHLTDIAGTVGGAFAVLHKNHHIYQPVASNSNMRDAQDIILCFSPDELEDEGISLDAPSGTDRLRQLLTQLRSRLAADEAASAPQPLHIAKPREWQKTMQEIHTLQRQLDLLDDESQTIQRMLATTQGNARMTWFNHAAVLHLQRGEYAEAEEIARMVLPWTQHHPKMGFASPQALGTMRILIEAGWMQGDTKREEARQLFLEASKMIARMSCSASSESYQDSERTLLVALGEKFKGLGGLE